MSGTVLTLACFGDVPVLAADGALAETVIDDFSTSQPAFGDTADGNAA